MALSVPAVLAEHHELDNFNCGETSLAQRARMRAEMQEGNSTVFGSGRLTPRPSCAACLLDEWLKKRARPNQAGGASRVFVICERNRVVGYYALSSFCVTPAIVPGRFRRNMPDPIPVVLLGRLAIDKAWQHQGIGRALFRDAAIRVSHAADAIGVRGIVVHAISDEARKFYLALGFTECPGQPMTLVVTLQDIRAVLG
ncbi:MAG: GNAT family N-acetyltransferase [Acidobacteriaceae bacterium]|nr:GNAT family N-acetyltransferase [Acidobacteriaceae bacterium]